MAEFLQFVFSGLTVGAIYALVAIGFTLIYNASDVVNFAQGEFVMLGELITVFLGYAGVPLLLASVFAIFATSVVGFALYYFAIRTARGANAVSLIIITIGASIFLRGAAEIIFDKRFHSLPPVFDSAPIRIGGAAILPQSSGRAGGRGDHRYAALGLHRPNAVRQGGDRNIRQPRCRAARGN